MNQGQTLADAVDSRNSPSLETAHPVIAKNTRENRSTALLSHHLAPFAAAGASRRLLLAMITRGRAQAEPVLSNGLAGRAEWIGRELEMGGLAA